MLSDDLRKCHEKLDRFEHSEKSLNKKVNDISIELDIASDKIMRMQKSFSWRCTSILRFFRRKFKQYSSCFEILSSKPKHCSVPSQNSVDCTQTIPVSPSFVPYDLPVFNESSNNELFSPFSKNDKLVISWIIPDFGVGSGGHTNIFRIIYWLEKFGHKSIIWITGGSKHGSPEQAKNVINSHFSQ